MTGFNRFNKNGWDGGNYGTTYCDLILAGLWTIVIFIIVMLVGVACLSC